MGAIAAKRDALAGRHRKRLAEVHLRRLTGNSRAFRWLAGDGSVRGDSTRTSRPWSKRISFGWIVFGADPARPLVRDQGDRGASSVPDGRPTSAHERRPPSPAEPRSPPAVACRLASWLAAWRPGTRRTDPTRCRTPHQLRWSRAPRLRAVPIDPGTPAGRRTGFRRATSANVAPGLRLLSRDDALCRRTMGQPARSRGTAQCPSRDPARTARPARPPSPR